MKQELIQINNKTVQYSSIRIEDIHKWDYPDFCDAFAAEAEFEDGTELNDEELEELNDKYGDIIHQKVWETLH
jgi:hypothetical protein